MMLASLNVMRLERNNNENDCQQRQCRFFVARQLTAPRGLPIMHSLEIELNRRVGFKVTCRGAVHNRECFDAGWSSLVARRAHNPKVVGSNPAPATNWHCRLQTRQCESEKAPF